MFDFSLNSEYRCIDDAFCVYRKPKHPDVRKSPFILDDGSILFWWWKVEYLYKPEVVTFQGEEAKKILEEYIRELEENRPEELTTAQAEAMMRVARGLITVIEGEPPVSSVKRQRSFFPTVIRVLKDRLAPLAREEDHGHRVGDTEPSTDCHHQPLPVNQQPK